MKPIAIFYHSVFCFPNNPGVELPSASSIIAEQMAQLHESGLIAAAKELHVGINGGPESEPFVAQKIPEFAKKTYHGIDSGGEPPTIMLLEEWVKTHPGWNVLYLHCKGASHPISTPYHAFAADWRRGMMQDLVLNWRQCVADLDSGYDIACSHWMWGLLDGTQHIPAGNFLWITSDFAAKLPSMFLRDRIKQDGIKSPSSRWEAEVYWGNGPRPNVKQYRPQGGGGVP